MVDRGDLLRKRSILVGPIVPEWFKIYSDGCSVPVRKKLKPIFERNARDACVIHDWQYYQARILWSQYSNLKNAGANPFEVERYKVLWKNKRAVADANFWANIKLLWLHKREGKRSLLGMAQALTYHKAVRLFGRDAAKTNPRDLAMARRAGG